MGHTHSVREHVNRFVIAIAVIATVLVLASPTRAQNFSVLYKFKGQPDDGANPYSGNLVLDEKRNLYGTTLSGGDAGFGTVFKVASNGTEPWHYSFIGQPMDGASPYGSLVRDGQGNLYGTTTGGGNGCSGGCGTVFKVSGSGTETILYSFVGSPTDGADPEAGLILDSEGNLYGTTFAGGIQNLSEDPVLPVQGTVFKVTPSGAENVLFTFICSDCGVIGEGRFGYGWGPEATLLLDSKGHLYGTAQRGGGGDCSLIGHIVGCGVAFEVGVSTGVLHSFKGWDGANPWSGLIFGANGSIAGTTYAGGTKKLGTVFELTEKGKETVLHSFSGSPDDGSKPTAALVLDHQGNLYGTTSTGGTYGYGTVFEINAAGQETVLHSFAGGVDGATPLAGLVLDEEGNLYGTTEYGGSSNCVGGCGVVFKLSP